jgi:predicted short-subunit dehydrogenase-like oxidoreductase (DUF2520 family)
MDFPVAIFGMGRFGRALASRLDAVGSRLARTGGRGRAHSKRLTPVVAPQDFLVGLAPRTLVILSVRDDSIDAVARDFARRDVTGIRFAHSSGASGLRALLPLQQAGAETGVFHILQSLPPEHGEDRIAGSYAAIAGPPALARELHALAEHIGVNPVELREEQWPAYHAAAVLASNALLGLIDSGRAILSGAGIEAHAAEAMLLPLVRGTLENAREFGLADALTGPVVRGDAGTIKRHLDVLSGPDRQRYIAAMKAVLALTRRSGRTPEAALNEIEQLLDNAQA